MLALVLGLAHAAELKPPTQIPAQYQSLVKQWLDVPCWKTGDKATYAVEGASFLEGRFTVEVLPETDQGIPMRFAKADGEPVELVLRNSRTLACPKEMDPVTCAGWSELGWMLSQFACGRMPLGVAPEDPNEQVTAPASPEKKVPGKSVVEVVFDDKKRAVGVIAIEANDKALWSSRLAATIAEDAAWSPSVTYTASWSYEDGSTGSQRIALTQER